MNYEELLIEADNNNINVKELPLLANDGLIKGNNIAIRKDIVTSQEKTCVLAEELGHFNTNAGNILNQDLTQNRKQEHLGRSWAYSKLIPLEHIISAFEYGCRNRFEFAEYLNVTEQFLMDAMQHYRHKYGCYKTIGNYTIFLYPTIDIIKAL